MKDFNVIRATRQHSRLALIVHIPIDAQARMYLYSLKKLSGRSGNILLTALALHRVIPTCSVL